MTAVSSTNAFKYQPLQEGEFRLLRILSEGGADCELVHSRINGAPGYLALSYTWGPAPFKRGRSISAKYSITLNGCSFPVQENLRDALEYLTEVVRESRCLFWVDAICINQLDLKERASQVQHMSDIYAKANGVCCWLGCFEDEQEISLAVELMKKFNRILIQGGTSNIENVPAVSTTLSDLDASIFPILGSECHRAWNGIATICNRSYWSRAWIYQEATGPRTTRFYCGKQYFQDVHLAAAVYFANHFASFPGFSKHFILTIASGAAFNFSAFGTKREVSGPKSFLEMLKSFRKTTSTDPLDKVYVPRGLADDVPSDKVVPDYTVTIQQAYSDVVLFALSQPGTGLDILGYVYTAVPDSSQLCGVFMPRVPSWVPDWRQCWFISPLSLRMYRSISAHTTKLPSKAYNAGGQFDYIARIEGHRFVVEGCIFDEVSKISSIWEQDFDSTSEVRTWAPSQPEGAYLTGESRESAFLATIVADMRGADQGRKNRMHWSILETRTDELTPEQARQKDDLNVAFTNACAGRRLCWTRKGYMGLVPAATKTRDLVCVFFGGQVLYILRYNGDGVYGFIGECYIHGLMDGEALPKDGTKPQDTRSFVLV